MSTQHLKHCYWLTCCHQNINEKFTAKSVNRVTTQLNFFIIKNRYLVCCSQTIAKDTIQVPVYTIIYEMI